MTGEEFDRTDFREICELFRLWLSKVRREDYRAATIACLIANLVRREGADPVEPGDFFASLRVEDKESTPDDLAAKILAAFGFTRAEA